MMRPRFSSGLVVGLSIGMPLGAFLVLFALPPRTGTSAEYAREIALMRDDIEALRAAGATAGGGDAATLQIQDALAQLAHERERVHTQLALFEELANQVSGGLARVHMRLDALERREPPQPQDRLRQDPRYREDW